MPTPVLHTDTIANTRTQIARQAWLLAVQVNSEIEAKWTVNDTEGLLDLACRQACEIVFQKGERERQFDTLVVDSDSSGQYALSEEIMAQSIRASVGGSVFITGYGYAEWRDSLEEVYQNDFISDLSKFTVLGGNKKSGIIYIADGTGTPIASTALTIKAARYFLFGEMPEQMKDDLILALRDLTIKEYRNRANGQGNA